MSNKTEVINRALIKIGANTIASPDEQSEQARKAALVFRSTAQAELRRQAWSFAKKSAALAPLAAPPADRAFRTAYNLPDDCLRLLRINGVWIYPSIREAGYSGSPHHTIEGRALLVKDSGALPISYVRDVSDEVAIWDAAFVDAFACRLAHELVHSIAKSVSLKQAIKQEYAEALKEAKRVNAIELPPEAITDDSWVLARLW